MTIEPEGKQPRAGNDLEAHQPPADAQSDTSVEFEQYGETLDSAGSVTGTESDVPKSLGRYEVRGLLGKGGFGSVYEGFDAQLDRRVAIKVPIVRQDRNVEEEFLQEARRLAQLQHPGIVAIHDVGITDGRCYIVSDFVAGKPLSQWLRENRPSSQESARIVAAVADALSHAHAQSTIHRDIKPDNIILAEGSDGIAPRLIDFGLAISEDAVADQRGTIAGTPAFMSPEQARGRAHRIDGRTDIYSLGIVLYYMLCGKLPFRSKDVRELLRQICEDAPQPPRQLVHTLSAELENICLKAIAKKEEDRYLTAGDFAAALRGVVDPSLAATVATSEPSPELTAASDSFTRSSIRRRREAERRQVTVMVCNCDVDDPGQSLESMDLEEQHELLQSFLGLCEEAVKRFEGTVTQSTGQELLVCFGFPVAHEDAPQRAVRTALKILDEMKHLNERLQKQRKERLSSWFAIHTGMAVAEETGVGDSVDSLSIVGEARSVASRLEAFAEPEQVIISGATHRLVEGSFICESRGTQKVKGINEPIELYQVIETAAVRNRVELVDPANLTPLIGRDTELSVLKDRWEQAVESMGQVVLLIGDAGLGKSRLIREIKEHVACEDPDNPPPVVEWRCSPYHASSGLFAATDYFEQLLGFTRDDSPQQRLDELAKHLDQMSMNSQEQLALFASFLSVPPDDRCAPLALSPQRQKEKTQELLLDWLRAYSSLQPVLFIVEDLHWVDPSTLEFLERHVEQGLHDSVLTIFTFRPEFRTPWQSSAHQTQIALNRLTRRQITEMMRQKIGEGDIADEIVAQVAARTDGVPLFVEEFAKVVEESGVLADRELTASIVLDAIPTSLQDLLAARLDRIASNPDVVQLAATLGREFTFELLQATSDLEDSDLQDELSKLVEAEMLFQKGRPPNCTYIFKHALLQDAAYNSLLKKRRQQFHKRIADVLQERFPETTATQPELLANHYTEAGETEKAVQYWFKAGQHAQQRSANTEAISHLSRGLQILDTLQESPQRDQLELGFQLTLAPVLMAARGWSAPEVGTAIERAQQLVSKTGSVEDQFFVMWGLWGWRIIRADMDICQGIADDIMQLVAESSEGNDLLSEAYWCVGATAYYKGDFKTGLNLLEQGLALIDDDRERIYSLKTGQFCSVLTRSHIALVLWELGFPSQAMQRADEMIRLAKPLGHPFSYAMGLFFRRQILEFTGRSEEAREAIEEEYNVCHENGFVFFEVHAVFGRGVSSLRQGDIDEARKLLDLGLDMLHATGGHLSMDHPYRNIAEAFLLAGLHDDANKWLNRGFDLVNNRHERGMESEFLRLQGELALAAADQIRAEECYQRAVEVAQQQQARSWELRAMISFAELKQSQGKDSEARQMLASTYGFFTEGFDTSDLIRARSLLNKLGAQA